LIRETGFKNGVFPDELSSASAKRGSSGALIERGEMSSETERAVSATAETGSKTIHELIQSCQVTQEGFRTAAQGVASDALKQLFGLYAQQRSRFAAELSGLAQSGPASGQGTFGKSAMQFADEAELVRNCLAREKGALAVYRKALMEQTLPTKTRFLVSAQLALLERVHNRIEAIENREGAE
jgi:hypothetical protein